MKTRTNNAKNSPARSAIVVIAAVILFAIAQCQPDTTPTPTAVPPTPTATLTTAPPTPAGDVTVIPVGQGFGASKGFWEVYFTAPTGSRDFSTYVNGIDVPLAAAINNVQSTLDIAAFEFNNPVLTAAVLNAKARGVRVRVVTDNEHGIGDDDTTLTQLQAAGIPIVDDARSGLMHNKFMILDSSTVWTGSWNYTINDTYRNNNNALVLRSRTAVQNYQAEFDEMFIHGQFGITSPVNTPRPEFTQDGVPIGIYFAAEEDVLGKILTTLGGAQHSIRFMTFSFTVDEIGAALVGKAGEGVTVSGIFERTGSETQFSELTLLFCAGLPVRQDGNPFVLHHKVFIVDDVTVITGSFNFSVNATQSNDENLVIISDPDLAAQYVAEFDRRWAEAVPPANLSCS